MAIEEFYDKQVLEICVVPFFKCLWCSNLASEDSRKQENFRRTSRKQSPMEARRSLLKGYSNGDLTDPKPFGTLEIWKLGVVMVFQG